MFKYIRQGWHGELTFTEILFGKHFCLDDIVIIIAYVGFYVCLLLSYNSYVSETLWVYVFLIYGVGFYIWLLRAFWGSANYARSRTQANLIRIFTVLLPVISIILFFLILLYWLVVGLIDNFIS